VGLETQSGQGESSTDDESAQLRRALSGPGVRTLFQPVVRLDNGDVVAYEALVRGPVGTSLERPERLFAAARREDLLAELDWACRAAAWRAVESANLPRGRTVLVNVEPETLGRGTPPWAEDLMTKAGSHLRLFVELTERALALRPAELLAAVERLRARGWGIALDDVGADPHSLALMPFLRPDVIKLDLRLVQANPSPAIAGIVSAVNAESERSGAVVLAEGIEHEEHLTMARSLGATLGQGWHFGRPDNLPVGEPAPAGRTARPARASRPRAGSGRPPSRCSMPSASIWSTRPRVSDPRPWCWARSSTLASSPVAARPAMRGSPSRRRSWWRSDRAFPPRRRPGCAARTFTVTTRWPVSGTWWW
jgi:EAL domain-containing protein (putative c-di-GMP-specific phosphodiesterase class I)